jgi:hypothetical protein
MAFDVATNQLSLVKFIDNSRNAIGGASRDFVDFFDGGPLEKLDISMYPPKK